MHTYDTLVEQAREGRVSMDAIDAAVRRTLRAVPMILLTTN